MLSVAQVALALLSTQQVFGAVLDCDVNQMLLKAGFLAMGSYEKNMCINVGRFNTDITSGCCSEYVRGVLGFLGTYTTFMGYYNEGQWLKRYNWCSKNQGDSKCNGTPFWTTFDQRGIQRGKEYLASSALGPSCSTLNTIRPMW